MNSSWKHVTRRMALGLSSLLLIMLLAACGGSGSTASPTATPTPKPPTPTPTPAVTLQTYTGTGFTIGYPQGWKVQSAGGQLAFTDALGVNAFSIGVAPNPGGVKSAGAVADATVALLKQAAIKNSQPATDVSATATVGGETWAQRGLTGTVNVNGQDVPAKLIVLVDNHPANSPTTQSYVIYYGGPSATFDLTNSTDFQAMLQSFKFTA